MRVVVGLFALTFSWAVVAQEYEAPAEAWRATDLTLELTKTFISNEKCASSQRYFDSCVNAINAAGRKFDPIRHFTADFTKPAPDFERLLRDMIGKLPATIPPQALLGSAITAHLATFDAHAYLRPTALIAAGGPGFGLGASVRKTNAGLVVEDVIDGSPALHAGLRRNDVLKSCTRDGKKTDLTGKGLDEVEDALQLSSGHPVLLGVNRAGSLLEMMIIPGPIPSENVTSQLSPVLKDGGYIRIHNFLAGKTCVILREQMQRLKNQGATQFILDLRGNPGGDFNEALCVAGLFAGLSDIVGTKYTPVTIPESQFIHVFDEAPGIEWHGGDDLDKASVPLVILVDAGSASASEIVAGSLQYLGLAWLVGERTFGKGSVQTIERLQGHPTLTIAATSARYYFPNGASIQGVGVEPSFSIPATTNLSDAESYQEREPEAFPNSAPATEGPWPDPRQDQIDAIHDCIQRRGVDFMMDQKYMISTGVQDHQHAYAAAVLKCLPR